LSIDLILNVNKPAGINSFDVIRILRKQLGENKMGYIGTLDPFASGVLPLFTGNYTKLIPFIANHRKEYNFVIELGRQTDTLDLSGKVIAEKPYTSKFSLKDVNGICQKYFLGDILQRPPRISAVKISGKRSYKLARRGIKVEVPVKNVFVHSVSITSMTEATLTGRLECSSGFYIRSFARDLAEKMETYGTVIELNRVESGSFKIVDSVNLDDIDENSGLNVEQVLNHYINVICVSDRIIRRLQDGVEVGDLDAEKGIYMIKNEDMSKMIIAENKDEGFKIIRVVL